MFPAAARTHRRPSAASLTAPRPFLRLPAVLPAALLRLWNSNEVQRGEENADRVAESGSGMVRAEGRAVLRCSAAEGVGG